MPSRLVLCLLNKGCAHPSGLCEEVTWAFKLSCAIKIMDARAYDYSNWICRQVLWWNAKTYRICMNLIVLSANLTLPYKFYGLFVKAHITNSSPLKLPAKLLISSQARKISLSWKTETPYSLLRTKAGGNDKYYARYENKCFRSKDCFLTQVSNRQFHSLYIVDFDAFLYAGSIKVVFSMQLILQLYMLM